MRSNQIKNQEKEQKNSGRGIFKILEFITEAIGWLQIVASPLLIGLAIGAIIYFPNPTNLRLVLGIIVALIGLLVGLIWATRIWKGKGTNWFLSRIIATPELDDAADNEKTNKEGVDVHKE